MWILSLVRHLADSSRSVPVLRALGSAAALAAILAAGFPAQAQQAAAQQAAAQDEASQDAEAPRQDAEPEPPEAEEVPETRRFEEVIEVTARRRSEDIQKVPVSVTAFDQQALEERSIRDLSDISEFTANMSFSTTAGFSDETSEAAVFIRGVGQVDMDIFFDGGVGIYVDGVYLARAQGGVLDLLDVDRVEVLRGPQGTLFGKNTNGGAIQLVTRRPGAELTGRAGLTVGRFDRLDGRLSADLPISESWHSSVALMSTNRDGWSRSLVDGLDYHDDHRDLGRVVLGWSPGDSFSAQLSADYTRERERGGNQLLLGTDPGAPLLAFYNEVLGTLGFTPYTAEIWSTGDFARSNSTVPAFHEQDTWGTHLDLQWMLRPDLSVRSISAYRAFDVLSLTDGDGSPNPVAERDLDREQYQFSQELQVSGEHAAWDLQWLVGGLYFFERPRSLNRQRVFSDLFAALESAPGPIFAPPGVPTFFCNPGPPPPGQCFGGAGNPLNFLFFVGDGIESFLDLENESMAVFGEGTWGLSDRLSLTLGARFTEDDKVFSYRGESALGEVTEFIDERESWSDWSGRASLAFQATPELLLYGTVSRGFKSGGFNGRPPRGSRTLPRFDPETVLAWELGMKSDWLDRRLRLNGATFFSDYEDIHFSALIELDGLPVTVTQNAGDAEIWGAELELQAYPLPSLLVTASIGHLNSRVVRLDPRVPVESVRVGNELPKAPSWTYAFGVQSSHQLPNRGALISRVDYTYREKMYQEFANIEAVAQPGYGLLGARIVYTPPSGRFDLALFGTNLTDEEYLESASSTGGFGIDVGIAGRPREWGLEATVSFR